jgi:hypothetical protein
MQTFLQLTAGLLRETNPNQYSNELSMIVYQRLQSLYRDDTLTQLFLSNTQDHICEDQKVERSNQENKTYEKVTFTIVFKRFLFLIYYLV